ncbi:MAG: hypothetical protein PHN72_01045 [Bacilli bacterium]|nr:hypothetical protein [Bacilli bacterium]
MEALKERNQNDSYQEYLEKLISLKQNLMENKEEPAIVDPSHINKNSYRKANQRGFTGPFMLGLLSFLFETLFLMVSFLIFR